MVYKKSAERRLKMRVVLGVSVGINGILVLRFGFVPCAICVDCGNSFPRDTRREVGSPESGVRRKVIRLKTGSGEEV